MSSRPAQARADKNRVSNPLAGLTREELFNDVQKFANDKDLTDYTELIQRGALVAQDPGRFEELDVLAEDEKDALRFEAAHRWKHPFALYFTIIVCSIGAAVQGWDQTGSNGANLSFPVEFGIGEGETDGAPNQVRDSWLVGVVNAGPYIGSAFLGCWLSDPCNFYFGRRGTIFISAIFCVLTPIGGAVSQTWPQLFITRLLM